MLQPTPKVKLQERRAATPSRTTPTTAAAYGFRLDNNNNGGSRNQGAPAAAAAASLRRKAAAGGAKENDGAPRRALDVGTGGGARGGAGGAEGGGTGAGEVASAHGDAAAAAAAAVALEELRAEAQGMDKEIAEQERLLSAYQKENERLVDKSKKVGWAACFFIFYFVAGIFRRCRCVCLNGAQQCTVFRRTSLSTYAISCASSARPAPVSFLPA